FFFLVGRFLRNLLPGGPIHRVRDRRLVRNFLGGLLFFLGEGNPALPSVLFARGLLPAAAARFFRRRNRARETPRLGRLGAGHHLILQLRQSAQQLARFKRLDDVAFGAHPLRLLRLERLQFAHGQQP